MRYVHNVPQPFHEIVVVVPAFMQTANGRGSGKRLAGRLSALEMHTTALEFPSSGTTGRWQCASCTVELNTNKWFRTTDRGGARLMKS